MSNYNYGLEPSVQSSGGSKVRFVLIFILISAVTAALVWWFWPGREELQKEKKPAQSAQGSGKPAAGNSGEKQDPENGADVKKSAVEPRPVETKPADPPKPETPPQADNTKDAGNTAPSPAVDPTDPPVPKKGELTEADKKGVDLPAVPADTPLTQEQQSALERAEQFLASKDYANAEKSTLKALAGCAENSAFYRKVWRVLTEVRCSMALYGKKPPYVVRSVIRSGDTLSGIAARYFTTVELLRKKNNISGSRIFVGRAVYAVPGDWKIVVSKKFRLLKLFQVRKDGDKLFAVWEVGIGRMGKTPSAEFAIAARVRHPDWYLADGRVIKYKDPENQLGDYFLKLAPASSPGRPLLGYGIHGARDENTVGRSLSSGCIRMKNKDVEMLYYLVPAGCRVSIVEE